MKRSCEYGDSESNKSGLIGVVVVVILILCVAGLIYWVKCIFDKPDSDITVEEEVIEDSSEDDEVLDTDVDETEEEEETDTAESDTNDNDVVEVPAESVTDFSNFSTSNQTIGQSNDDVEYTLKSLSNVSEVGYHRIEFVLESDETSLPKIDASLDSAGGFIQIKFDRVTHDETGLGYQETKVVTTEGILSIYHGVTAVSSEEVYLIGIAGDPEFCLHEGDGALTVILDVKYTGSSNESVIEYTDPEEFSSTIQTLSDTNTQGDARLNGYTWSIESSVIKFVWMTAADSGNPTPPVSVSYDSDVQEVTVTFDELQSDSVIGSDGEFDTELSDVLNSVSGTRVGTKSTFVFDLSRESTFRIYRNLSPNQVVLEVKR